MPSVTLNSAPCTSKTLKKKNYYFENTYAFLETLMFLDFRNFVSKLVGFHFADKCMGVSEQTYMVILHMNILMHIHVTHTNIHSFKFHRELLMCVIEKFELSKLQLIICLVQICMGPSGPEQTYMVIQTWIFSLHTHD